MKKILSFVLVLFTLILSFTSCSEDVEYEDIEYREDGLFFVLPNTMRRKASDYYEFYFSSEMRGIGFGAKKITPQFLESENIDTSISAGEYVDMMIEKQDFEKSKIFYQYFEDSKQYNFRYTFVDEDGDELFFYVTVMGDVGNIWYIEMCCKNEESSEYLTMFEKWRRNVGTY